jgi:hypothetical protein
MSVKMLLGMNRTGTMLKPNETQEMLEGVAEFIPDRFDVDGSLLLALRADYIHYGEPVGSIPLPPGKADSPRSGRKDEAGLLHLSDKLGERLAFEATGTRLYEAFLGKLATTQERKASPSIREVEQILNEEHEHFLLLEQVIRELGGDPTAVTPAADVAGVIASGIMQVITDPRTTIDQSLCALLTAELSDNDGWRMLGRLGGALGQKELARECERALEAENRHLELVRSWLEMGAMQLAGVRSLDSSTNRSRGSTRSGSSTEKKPAARKTGTMRRKAKG